MEAQLKEMLFFSKLKYAAQRFFEMLMNALPSAENTTAERNIKKSDINKHAEFILDTYGNSIFRLAYSYLHNMSDAEDALQETLMKLLKSNPDFESGEHEKAWLLHVAANICKNKIKYNNIRNADELDENLAADENENLSYIWEAVKKLPESCREAIHLFYAEGLPSKEIARILNRSEATVRSDLSRGRERLKNILKEDYDFE